MKINELFRDYGRGGHHKPLTQNEINNLKDLIVDNSVNLLYPNIYTMNNEEMFESVPDRLTDEYIDEEVERLKENDK